MVISTIIYETGIAYPNLLTLIGHAEHLDQTAESAAAVLQEGVELLESSQTLEEAWHNTGKLMAQGYATPFKFVPFSINGHMALMITFEEASDLIIQLFIKHLTYEKDFLYNVCGLARHERAGTGPKA